MKIRTFVIAATDDHTVYIREKNTDMDPVPCLYFPALGVVKASHRTAHFDEYPASVRASVEKFFKQAHAMPESGRKTFVANTKPWAIRVRGE